VTVGVACTASASKNSCALSANRASFFAITGCGKYDVTRAMDDRTRLEPMNLLAA